MLSFPDLLKKIRDKSGLTQSELAKVLGVSTILISMVETGQKEVSKNLIVKLAKKMDVHPSSILPFVFSVNDYSLENLPNPEKTLLKFGEKVQTYLIEKKATKLRDYA